MVTGAKANGRGTDITGEARCNVSSARPGTVRTSHRSAFSSVGANRPLPATANDVTPPRDCVNTLAVLPPLAPAPREVFAAPRENSSDLVENVTSSEASRAAHDPAAGTTMVSRVDRSPRFRVSVTN
jgi:hypothetical protein